MTPNELAESILTQYRESIMRGNNKLDLHKVIAETLEKYGKAEYKRGYQKAKEKFRASKSNPKEI